MTVGELIAKLQEFDQNMMVVVDGYEGGVDELTTTMPVSIALGYNADGWWYGDHEVVTDSTLSLEEKEKYPVVTAVLLPR
jgi:hypothetical protein